MVGVYGDAYNVTVNAVCPATVCWGVASGPLWSLPTPPSSFDVGQVVTFQAKIYRWDNSGSVTNPPNVQCALYDNGVEIATASTNSNGIVTFNFSISTPGAHKLVIGIKNVACDPNGPCYNVVPGCGLDGTGLWCDACPPGYCTMP